MMGNDLQEAEYSSLRNEMISAIERAFSFWKWGLISLFSVYASTLLSFARIEFATHETSASFLQTAFVQYPLHIAISIFVFSITFILLICWIVCGIEKGVDRVGSYIAVFHERGTQSSAFRKGCGWHTWNRIEKSYSKSKKEFPESSPGRVIYSQKNLMVYIVFFALFIYLYFGLATILLRTPQWSILALGTLSLIVTFVGIWLLNRYSRYAPTFWNKRWLQLSRCDDDEIKSVLRQIGLEHSNSEGDREHGSPS